MFPLQDFSAAHSQTTSHIQPKPRDSTAQGSDKQTKLIDKSQGQSTPLARDTAVGLVHDIQMMANKLSSLYTDSMQPMMSNLPSDKLLLIEGEFV